jgi:hypothetical protein
MANSATKLSQRQILANIVPTDNTHPKWNGFRFAQISGGEITASVEKIYEGGSQFPTLLCAPAEIGDITLTAHYDDSINQVLTDDDTYIARKLRDMRQLVGRAYYTINVQSYDCDIQVNGTDRQYTKALLIGLTEPDGDSSSGAPATFSLTFAVQNVSVPSQ